MELQWIKFYLNHRYIFSLCLTIRRFVNDSLNNFKLPQSIPFRLTYKSYINYTTVNSILVAWITLAGGHKTEVKTDQAPFRSRNSLKIFIF